MLAAFFGLRTPSIGARRSGLVARSLSKNVTRRRPPEKRKQRARPPDRPPGSRLRKRRPDAASILAALKRGWERILLDERFRTSSPRNSTLQGGPSESSQILPQAPRSETSPIDAESGKAKKAGHEPLGGVILKA